MTPPPARALTVDDAVGAALPGESRVAEAAERSLTGERRGIRAVWPFLGPAFIAAVAYVDPGNFATNIAAGAKYGYMLLWVILAANLMAMLIQTLSAKLGIATGMNLAEVCRDQFPNPVTVALWVQAELIAMATDLAEFLGAAIGLNLLFGVPLLPAGVITGVFAFALLALQTRGGFRHMEAAIVCLVGVIVVGFAFQMLHADPSPSGDRTRPAGADVLRHGERAAGIRHPRRDRDAPRHLPALRADAAARGRANDDQRRRIFRFERVDVVIAMTIAGLVNMAMLITAAGVFHANGLTGVDSIDKAYSALGSVVGGHAQTMFAIALLASGLSSSSVGTLAGQVVMQGFIRRQIPLFLRRAVTMAPALLVLAVGVNPSKVLVLSQVALSFGIPFALIPLVIFCRNRRLMGELTNRPLTTAAAIAVAAVIVSLNIFLIGQTIMG